MKSNNFSYINTLVSDAEDMYELKTLFENIDRTIEMLEEEAPVPSSPMKNVEQMPQTYPNEKSKNIPSDKNSNMVQAWINPSTLGPKYILVEVEKFRNLSPEDCEKLTSDINSTRQNLPASTQTLKNKDMESPDKSFGTLKMLTSSFTTIFFMQGARYIITSVIIPAFILGKKAAMGLLGMSNDSTEDTKNGSELITSEIPSKLNVFKDPKWIIAAGASVCLLIVFTKILKRYNRKNKKNSGVQTNIKVANVSNESIDLIITNEYYDNDIPFKKSLEIMNESILNINKIKSFFDHGFDSVKNACETIEETSDTQSKFKSFLEKIAGITNYCIIKAKAAFTGSSSN